MRRGLPTAPTPLLIVLGLAGAALLGGCGSGGSTKTVSVASAPPVQSTGATTTPATHAASPATTSTSTTPPASAPSGGAPGPATTRTATAPAFTHTTTAAEAEGLSGAEAVLRAHGFTATATSDYHPSQTLRVLIGARTGASAGNAQQQAFFFVGGRYIGTDAKQPSASIHVVSQGETEVTLAYALSGAGGGAAAGEQATVRFQLDNGQLTPLDPIPPASKRQ